MMIQKHPGTIFKLLVGLLLLSSCASEPGSPEEIKPKELQNVSYPFNGDLELGDFDSISYQNNYFGFSFEHPKTGWYILNPEQYKARVQGNLEMLNDKGASEKSLEVTKENLHNLFTVRKISEDSSTKNYQSISFMAEGLDKMPGITDAKEYTLMTENYIKEHFSTGYPKYTTLYLDSGMIGGRKFILSNWKIEYAPDDIYYQNTYTAQFGKYLLNVLVNYRTKQDSTENQKILSTVKWK